jgi:hypothetical protein
MSATWARIASGDACAAGGRALQTPNDAGIEPLSIPQPPSLARNKFKCLRKKRRRSIRPSPHRPYNAPVSRTGGSLASRAERTRGTRSSVREPACGGSRPTQAPGSGTMAGPHAVGDLGFTCVKSADPRPDEHRSPRGARSARRWLETVSATHNQTERGSRAPSSRSRVSESVAPKPWRRRTGDSDCEQSGSRRSRVLRTIRAGGRGAGHPLGFRSVSPVRGSKREGAS